MTDDEATAKSVLTRASIRFDLKDVVNVKLMDRPGELGKMARRLAKSMVNVDSIFIMGNEGGKTEMALTVDNLKKAEDALK